ncbi:MAG TPA: hypothetical protein VGA22_03430 [Gemmatimonadales bacterium]|jgi:hypothetical protein
MSVAGLLLLIQAVNWQVAPARPSVGDTVRVSRVVVVEGQVAVRPQPVAATDVLEPLADPVTRISEGRLLVEYELAFFATGVHTVTIPTAELIAADGTVQVLPEENIAVTVVSILPDSAVAPHTSLGPFAASPRRAWLLPVLLVAVSGAVTAWVARRRRVGPRARWEFAADRSVSSPLERWEAAGERRAVVTLASDAIRARIATMVPTAGAELTTDECLARLADEGPAWPLREIAGVLHELDRARFAPAVPGDVSAMIDRAEGVIRTLEHVPLEVTP